jgi:hypothetical protein
MPAVHLAIASLRLRLELDDELVAAVRSRYAGFVIEPTAESDVWLEMQAERRAPGASRDLPAARLSGGVLRIDEPDSFTVELDLESGRGRARCPVGSGDGALAEAPVGLRGVVSSVCAAMLPRRGRGVLLHAAGVVVGGRGVVAVGESGAGKSTLCAMYPEEEQLNDEIVAAVDDGHGSFELWSTPFSGTLDLPRRRASAPLALGLLLHKAPRARLVPARRADLFRALVRSAAVLRGDEVSETLAFTMCGALIDAAPWRELHFPLDAVTTVRAIREQLA